MSLREPNTEPIPGYRLIEPLGTGGFGEVWKCEAPGGIFKAIKFVYGNLNSCDQDSVRAEQEHRALQRIKEVRHPFVCSLDRIEVCDGELVIVMELADRTLHDMQQECLAAGMIGIARDNLMRYMRDVAEALDFMNEKHNLQHLDVKPRNLFLISDRVKVADFGLVKTLERQGSSGLLGGVTPLYAPPETFVGKISPQSDQYSLAIVFQELLTGHRPFQAKNVRQLAQQHLKEDPDLRSLPESDRPIIGRALSKDPNKRFASCMAMVSQLYKARQPIRVEDPKEYAEVGVRHNKTMAETMEDMALPDMEEIVNLASSPPRRVVPPMSLKPDDNSISYADALPQQSPRPVEVSGLGVTVAQPDNGALKPTLIIGLGNFGRKALMEIRCRLLDRFGDLQKIPLFRFLTIDTDAEGPRQTVNGAPSVSLSRNDFLHLPLQTPGKYRNRNLDQLVEWLPRERLYAIPRSLQTMGNRALGRLAFADHQQRVVARIRKDLQDITNPDRIYEAVSQTGLALRDSTPRVYVIAPAGGGSSGMVPDLGYALRRLLAHLNFHDATVTLFLLSGAPNDPSTPKHELANTYATLTELNHFNDSQVRFVAQYGADGQRIVDENTPFTSTYLLPLAERTAQDLDESIAHLGNYLFHELTTPLGRKLDILRHQSTTDNKFHSGALASGLRTFATYNVWFPRGLLLHLAARQACKKIVELWTSSGPLAVNDTAQPEIQKLFAKITGQADFGPDKLLEKIEKSSATATATEAASSPSEYLSGLLAKLEEQVQEPLAQDDPINWAKQALHRIREFVGNPDDSELGEWRKTKLMRSMSLATQKIVEEWNGFVKGRIHALMDLPGARLAVGENLINQLVKWASKTGEAQLERFHVQVLKTAQIYKQLQVDLQDLSTRQTGFRLFGGSSRQRQLRTFLDRLAQYARSRLQDELLQAVRHAYTALGGKLGDHGRDLGICRQRLRHLLDSLDRESDDGEEDLNSTHSGEITLSHSPVPSPESFYEVTRQSRTARVVLPEGEEHLEAASLTFLRTLADEQWRNLDRDLTERVLEPRGGLYHACMNGGDLIKYFAVPMVHETGLILGQHLPVMDVADILRKEISQMLAGAKGQGRKIVSEQTQIYLERATPPLYRAGKDVQEFTFLLTPASPSGKTFAEAALHVVPSLQVVRVSGQANLMFLREQAGVTPLEFARHLKPCKSAYEAAAHVPNLSPHARFDILDWLPLDP